MRTHDFFKALDFVNGIVMQAGFAEIHLMLTVANIYLHAFFTMLFYLTFTDFARLDVSDTKDHFLNFSFYGRSKS